VNIVYGLGGRDVSTTDLKGLYQRLERITETGDIGEVYTHMGVREA
jgi:hypothetical protein